MKFKLINRLNNPTLSALAIPLAVAVYRAVKRERTFAVSLLDGRVIATYEPKKDHIIITEGTFSAGFYNGPHSSETFGQHLLATITEGSSTGKITRFINLVDTRSMNAEKGKIGAKPLFDLAVAGEVGGREVYIVGQGLLSISQTHFFGAAGVERGSVYLATTAVAPVNIHSQTPDLINSVDIITVAQYDGHKKLPSDSKVIVKNVTGFKVYIDSILFPEPKEVPATVVGSAEHFVVTLPQGTYHEYTTPDDITTEYDLSQFTTSSLDTATKARHNCSYGGGTPVFGRQYVSVNSHYVTPYGVSPGFATDQQVLQYYDYKYTDYSTYKAVLYTGLFKVMPSFNLSIVSVTPLVLEALALVPVFGDQARRIEVPYALVESVNGSNEPIWAYKTANKTSTQGLYIGGYTDIATGFGKPPPLTTELIKLNALANSLVISKGGVYPQDTGIGVVGLQYSTDAVKTVLYTKLEVCGGVVGYTTDNSTVNTYSPPGGIESSLSESQIGGSYSAQVFEVSYSNSVFGVVNSVNNSTNTLSRNGHLTNGYARYVTTSMSSKTKSKVSTYLKEVSISSDGEFKIQDVAMVSTQGTRTIKSDRVHNGKSVISAPAEAITTCVESYPAITLNHVGHRLYARGEVVTGSRSMVGAPYGFTSSVSGPYPLGDVRPAALDVGIAVAGPYYDTFMVDTKEIQDTTPVTDVLTGAVSVANYNNIGASLKIRGTISVSQSAADTSDPAGQLYPIKPFTTGNAVMSVSTIDYTSEDIGIATYFGSGITNPEGDNHSTTTLRYDILYAPKIDDGCTPFGNEQLDLHIIDKGAIVVVGLLEGKVVFDIYYTTTKNTPYACELPYCFDLADVFLQFTPSQQASARGYIQSKLAALNALRYITPALPKAVSLADKAVALSIDMAAKDEKGNYKLATEATIEALNNLAKVGDELFTALYIRDSTSTHDMREIAKRVERHGITYIMPAKTI